MIEESKAFCQLMESKFYITLCMDSYCKTISILSQPLRDEIEHCEFFREYEREWILNELSMFLTGEDFLTKVDKGEIYWQHWKERLLCNYKKLISGKFVLKPYTVDLNFKEYDGDSNRVKFSELKQEKTFLAENMKDLVTRIKLSDWDGLILDNYKILKWGQDARRPEVFK